MSLFSLTFFVFLLVVSIAYFVTPKKYQWCCLLVASYVFYMWINPKIVLFLLFATLSVFFVGLWLQNLNNKCSAALVSCETSMKKTIKQEFTKKKRLVLAIGIVSNFFVLAIVKYSGFMISNINSLLNMAKIKYAFNMLDIALPLGISFYTFQSAGYLIDVYRGKVSADRNILKFALFVSYFPQIVQGPISRYNDLAHQLYEPHTFDYQRVKFGAQRIFWGLFKKLVIADRMAIIVNQIFGDFYVESYVGFTVFIAVLFYGVQIYADFSGGMDIIYGVSQIFGINLVENFRRPFMAKSVSEFWQRWHITLGSWMRDYVFYPLALSKPFNNFGKLLRKTGNKYIAKVVPTCLASFIVFTLIGIWHGSSWKYFAFGLYSAYFVSTATLLEPFYEKCRKFFRVDTNRFSFRAFQVVRTLFLVTLGRYFSRAGSFTQAVNMIKATFSEYNPWILIDGTLYKFGIDQKNFSIMILMVILLFLVDALQEKGYHIRETLAKQGIVFRWLVYLALLFIILIFGMYGPGYDVSNFIYQGF